MALVKYPLVTVVGPTAIGKTAFSIELAKHWETEIISADSRQFYKEMSIGTAVPSPEELGQVPHHFIQHLSIQSDYSAAQFAQDALPTAKKILKSTGRALVVGGSGLYTDALLKGLNDFPRIPSKIRNELRKRLELEGLESLQDELKKVDPDYAKQVDLQNPVRLLRALEVFHSSGQPFSGFLKGAKAFLPDPLYIGVVAPRENIYQRIEERVNLMIEQGLVEEARSVYPYKNLNALNTVGYKELFSFFDGNSTLEEAIAEIKQNTRRFAKRQLTWYRKNKSIRWLASNWASSQKLQLANLWSEGKSQPPVLLVMGVSGSGKSTLAKALAQSLSLPYLDADDFHPPANIKKMSGGRPLNDKDRQPWLEGLAFELLKRQDTGVVLACSALKEKYRRTLAEYSPMQTIYLKGSYDYILQRMQGRKDHFMPIDLLQSQFRTLEEPENALQVEVEWDLDQALQNIYKSIEKKNPY